MEAIKILESSILDIIFENRNKQYGAYLLRKNYYKQLLLALAITFLIAALFSAYSLFKKKDALTNLKPTIIVTLDPYTTPQRTKKPNIKIQKPQKAEAPPKIAMQKFTKVVVAPDNTVKDVVPKQDVKLTIGPVTQKGKTSNGMLAAPPEVKGIGGNHFKLGGSNGDAIGKVFTNVQVEAKFPGGEEAWQKYLKVNLRQNIPIDNNAPNGKYKITISFLVSADGNISEVKVIDAPSPDYGTAAEAIRVIMRGPKWMPAIQNGRPVTYRQKQTIIFDVQE